MSLTEGVKSGLSMKLMERIAMEELEDESVNEAFDGMQKEAGGREDFVSKSRLLWAQKREFSFPQPGLRRDRYNFNVYSDDTKIKRLTASFDKRTLIRPRIEEDESLEPSRSLPEILKYPSVPLGFREESKSQSES